MGVVILLAVIFLMCLVIQRIDDSLGFQRHDCIAPFLGMLLSALCIVVCGGVFIAEQYDCKRLEVAYRQDKIQFELACANPDLGEVERTVAIRLATNNNSIIQQQRLFVNDFWVGWFFGDSVGKLETFDLNRIPKAKRFVAMDENVAKVLQIENP